SLLLLAYATDVNPHPSSTSVQSLKRRRVPRRLHRRHDNDSDNDTDSDDGHETSEEDDQGGSKNTTKNILMPNCSETEGSMKKVCEKIARFLKGGLAIISMGSKKGNHSEGD
ncbi:hypothetical protein H4R35_002567, partial [Dimargaris xerosporica]